MSAAAGYPLAVPPNVVGGVGQGPGPNPVAYGTMPGQPPNGASGAYGQAPGPMQQHHMQYSYAPNPAMDQYGMQTPYGHMNGTNYGSMIPTSMSTIKTEGPTSIYDPRNSYSYTPMDNGANGMGPPQQMAMRQQYSMQPQSMSSPMHPQMMPQMMQAQQQQRVNCQPNCSTASVSVASPMTHTSMHQQPTVQSPGGNRTPSYMTKAAKNQHPQQSPSHPSVNTPNMMGAQQQTCSSISNSLGSGITLSHLQSPPQAQNGGGPARILIHSSHSVQLNSPAPASTPPTPHLSHPPLQQTYQAIMVKDESSQQQQQQQQACARPGALPSPPSADSSFTTVTHYEMPAAMQNMKEQFKRCNPRLVQYYDAPRRQLRTPYPIGNHVPAPKEPPTFAFLNGTKFYELQYERRIPPSQGMEQHISMGPPMVPPPLNRSQSMHASMMPTQFAPTPQQAPPTQQTGSSKPAPKKSRSVSDADHFHNPMMAANQQNQQMMANMQPGNGQMQQQAQPHYMPHMGQQPQQQMNSSYQMPPLNRSMSAGYMMTGGNQMMQQSMMQGQQGMPQMHQMDMNQARYGAPQNGPMSSQPQQQQQQQKPQQQQQPMMMQSQQPTPQSYSNPGSQQNVQHTQQQIEYYCSGCMNPIQQNQPYIRCNGDASCRRVFHRECSRLTPEAASRLEMESSTCKWVCDNCASLAIR